MVDEVIILKGYSSKGEVWAVCKDYGEDDYKTDYICRVSATDDLIKEYGRQRNVFNNRRKKANTIGRASTNARQ